MRFSSVAILASAATLATAANVTVTVGDQGSLAFNPTSVSVQAGDTINFEFRGKNHSVTQSTFANPCTLQTTPAAGIDSGFMPVAAGATSFPTWSITIQNASAPLWFFCAQTNPANHCHAGMVFAVNPTAEKSFDAFQTAAKAAGGSSSSAAGGYGSPAGTGTGTGSGSGSGSTATAGSGSTTGTGAASASGTSKPNGALRMGGSAAGVLLAGVGLVAGLVL
jgi:hypothetical protein